jgi:hypothetical protein
MTYAQYTKKYGTVDFNGKEYALTCDAEAGNYGTDGAVRYYANAIDADSKEYQISWQTSQEWDDAQELNALQWRAENLDLLSDAEIEEIKSRVAELEAAGVSTAIVDDESNACDWDTPVAVERL